MAEPLVTTERLSKLLVMTDYQRNRARRMSALADIEQLKLKRVRGEMHHGRDVEYLMTSMLTSVKSRLMALPSRVAASVVNKSVGEAAETIRIEIYEALRELSEYDPAAFESANEEYLSSIGVASPNGSSNGQEPSSRGP